MEKQNNNNDVTCFLHENHVEGGFLSETNVAQLSNIFSENRKRDESYSYSRRVSKAMFTLLLQLLDTFYILSIKCIGSMTKVTGDYYSFEIKEWSVLKVSKGDVFRINQGDGQNVYKLLRLIPSDSIILVNDPYKEFVILNTLSQGRLYNMNLDNKYPFLCFNKSNEKFNGFYDAQKLMIMNKYYKSVKVIAAEMKISKAEAMSIKTSIGDVYNILASIITLGLDTWIPRFDNLPCFKANDRASPYLQVDEMNMKILNDIMGENNFNHLSLIERQSVWKCMSTTDIMRYSNNGIFTWQSIHTMIQDSRRFNELLEKESDPKTYNELKKINEVLSKTEVPKKDAIVMNGSLIVSPDCNMKDSDRQKVKNLKDSDGKRKLSISPIMIRRTLPNNNLSSNDLKLVMEAERQQAIPVISARTIRRNSLIESITRDDKGFLLYFFRSILLNDADPETNLLLHHVLEDRNCNRETLDGFEDVELDDAFDQIFQEIQDELNSCKEHELKTNKELLEEPKMSYDLSKRISSPMKTKIGRWFFRNYSKYSKINLLKNSK